MIKEKSGRLVEGASHGDELMVERLKAEKLKSEN
jgi:hypothetical protein